MQALSRRIGEFDHGKEFGLVRAINGMERPGFFPFFCQRVQFVWVRIFPFVKRASSSVFLKMLQKVQRNGYHHPAKDGPSHKKHGPVR